MALKNYTRVEVGDQIRTRLLAILERLNTDTDVCDLCSMPPGFAYEGRGAVCYRCQRDCAHTETLTGYIVMRNGAPQVKSMCFRCGANRGNVKRGATYLDVCLRDNRDSTSCEHCGSIDGVEFHHYAPRNTFPDADSWATGYLCPPCHHLWHRTMDGYRWNRSHKGRPATDDEVIRQLIEVTAPQSAVTDALKKAGVL